jgi:hypothetical protein
MGSSIFPMKQQNFIQEYCETVDAFHGRRPDVLWFSTWVASKSPYFDFPKKFSALWANQTALKTVRVSRLLLLILRLTVTLTSLCLKACTLKLLYRNELKSVRSLKKINVVRTFLYSSDPDARDPFWGDLIPLLEKNQPPLLIIYDPGFSIFKCKGTYQKARNNFPYYVFLSPRNLIKRYFQQINEAFQVARQTSHSGPRSNENPEIQLLIDTYRQEILAPLTLSTWAFYDCFAALMTEFEIHHLYLTFENNPWEKMCYLARRDLRKEFKVIGFQHSTIQEGATNYFLSEYEATHRLHPDLILCVGEMTLDLLKQNPHYRKIRLENGCALRYSRLTGEPTPPHADPARSVLPTKLLIALDGIADAVDCLHMLLDFFAQHETSELEIKVKEHPNFKIAKMDRELFNHPFFQNGRIATEPLPELLAWADILLYSGSTVSLEALAMGKPVIQFSPEGSLFNYDPLFQFTANKYKIKTAADLARALTEITRLSPSVRAERAAISISFAQAYFSPCTRESIERFLLA